MTTIAPRVASPCRERRSARDVGGDAGAAEPVHDRGRWPCRSPPRATGARGPASTGSTTWRTRRPRRRARASRPASGAAYAVAWACMDWLTSHSTTSRRLRRRGRVVTSSTGSHPVRRARARVDRSATRCPDGMARRGGGCAGPATCAGRRRARDRGGPRRPGPAGRTARRPAPVRRLGRSCGHGDALIGRLLRGAHGRAGGPREPRHLPRRRRPGRGRGDEDVGPGSGCPIGPRRWPPVERRRRTPRRTRRRRRRGRRAAGAARPVPSSRGAVRDDGGIAASASASRAAPVSGAGGSRRPQPFGEVHRERGPVDRAAGPARRSRRRFVRAALPRRLSRSSGVLASAPRVGATCGR